MSGSVSNLTQSREWFMKILAIAGAAVAQQLLASFWYATRETLTITGKVELLDWQFWYFWNDYWIFLKYLDWPRRYGDALAAESNLVAAMLIVGVYGIWKLTDSTDDFGDRGAT